ncbi:hypothetical protein ILFOPFJJ_05988 [Ensifer psoraleae]|nr:hypothetical protein [Sinorhizobium psoraleae]
MRCASEPPPEHPAEVRGIAETAFRCDHSNRLVGTLEHVRATESRMSMNADRGEIPSASLKCRSRDRFSTSRCLAISATESGASRLCCIRRSAFLTSGSLALKSSVRPGCGVPPSSAPLIIMMFNLFVDWALPMCLSTSKPARWAVLVPPEHVRRSRSTTKIWSDTGLRPSNWERKS